MKASGSPCPLDQLSIIKALNVVLTLEPILQNLYALSSYPVLCLLNGKKRAPF